MRAWSWKGALVSAAILVGLGIFWANLAPAAIGGDSTYLVTSGISMEPNFHTGDLVVLRPSSAYRIGEIVGYRAPLLGIVLHRIIGERGGHFYMKGDNNHFVDPYHPAPSDVVGKLWLHLPKVGSLISSPGKRQLAAVAASAATAGTVLLPSAGKRRRRHKKAGARDKGGSHGATPRSAPSRGPGSGGAVMGVMGLPGQVAASVVSLLALGSLALGAVSFTRPAWAPSAKRVPYTQAGTWAYHAKATGNVYQDGVVGTGEPIFTAVAPVVAVSFDYRLVTPVPAAATGSARLLMVVSSSNGWSRTYPLTRQRPFSGQTSRLTGHVDVRSVQGLLARIQAETGQTTTTGSYSVAVRAAVDVHGTLEGAGAFAARFGPALSFTLGSGELQAVYGQPGTPGTLAQLLHPSAQGAVTLTQKTPAKLSIFSAHPSVESARVVAVSGLLATLVALGIIALLLRRAAQAGEVARIEARYRPLLVAAERPPSLAVRDVVRLVDIRDLVRVAERGGHMIVHCAAEGGRDYFVRAEATTYLYSARSGGASGGDHSGLSATLPGEGLAPVPPGLGGGPAGTVTADGDAHGQVGTGETR